MSSYKQLTSAPLFVIAALIWGSTFYAIKFQLGEVSPVWSVSYRFLLAGTVLLLFAKFRGLNLRFSARQHRWMLLQGIFLFGLNYWLVYTAEQELTSALAAIAFATIIFLNIFFGKVFLGKAAEKKVILGAILGVAGTVLLFQHDLSELALDELPLLHIVLCFLSVTAASLGNIISAYNQSNSLPIIQTNAFGMFYGGIAIGLIALVSGEPMTFDTDVGYIASLLYLSIFGSIFAFGAYLTLVGKIGADRAAYVLIVIPVIAVLISMVFEDYQFGWGVLAGMLLILSGNVVVLRRKP